MATRSLIAIENSNKSINIIYCHWDGYLNGVGKTLLSFYNDKKKVEKLIKLGNISSLEKTLSNIKTYNEEGSKVDNEAAYKKYYREQGTDYAYLFKNNKWYVSSHPSNPFELLESLISESKAESLITKYLN